MKVWTGKREFETGLISGHKRLVTLGRIDYGRRNKTAFRIQVEKGTEKKSPDQNLLYCLPPPKGTALYPIMCVCVCSVYDAIRCESDLSSLEEKHLAKRARQSQEDYG